MLHPELFRRICASRDLLRRESERFPDVKTVARQSGFSYFHFIRLFKAVFGETPHQLRAKSQIERAKHLLVLTDQTVTEVCMAVGFSSLGSFSALFSRQVGESPSSFLRKHRPTRRSRGQLPAQLAPGCFSLMGKIPTK